MISVCFNMSNYNLTYLTHYIPGNMTFFYCLLFSRLLRTHFCFLGRIFPDEYRITKGESIGSYTYLNISSVSLAQLSVLSFCCY